MNRISSNPNFRRGVSILALTATSLGSLACSTSDRSYVPDGSVESTTTTRFIAPNTSLSPEQKNKQDVKNYLEGSGHNAPYNTLARTYGERVVKAYEGGQLGGFDFYNLQKNHWLSKGEDIEGWGILQHNAAYGGSNIQVSIGVHMGANGKPDLNQGVKYLSVSDGLHDAMITAPDFNRLFRGEASESAEKSWQVISGESAGPKAIVDSTTPLDTPVETVKLIDLGAQNTVTSILDPALPK